MPTVAEHIGKAQAIWDAEMNKARLEGVHRWYHLDAARRRHVHRDGLSKRATVIGR